MSLTGTSLTGAGNEISLTGAGTETSLTGIDTEMSLAGNGTGMSLMFKGAGTVNSTPEGSGTPAVLSDDIFCETGRTKSVRW